MIKQSIKSGDLRQLLISAPDQVRLSEKEGISI